MNRVDRWLLPDGIEDILPAQAQELELIRRRLLDLYASWGYEYVIPPMVEFLESLLTGTGHDLDLKTFKVTDLVTGRTMGIRADMTPQVARIDAHSLNRTGPVRLCYAGTVLHSQADNMLASRTPIKVGAELFGDPDRQGDLEIVSLMIESLKVLGMEAVHVELGDVSIFRQLVEAAGLEERATEELF
ncbi:MAG: ATP phosphoribosyltransferase regulatory subunit, partial [Proteobacteria bacterium]|nr:ATP phosphoribosyltransferase regulatory subunit [Pseudomonadota bacterium]